MLENFEFKHQWKKDEGWFLQKALYFFRTAILKRAVGV